MAFVTRGIEKTQHLNKDAINAKRRELWKQKKQHKDEGIK
jgi:hypothetical protein